MAQTQTIKWTAVPNGYDSSGSNLKLSVLISPELAGGSSGTLADFPDWQDWPGTLTGLDGAEWEVQFNRADGSSTQTIPVALDTSGLNSALWKALFTASVRYAAPTPAQNNFRALAIASYPVQHVTGFLQNQFTQYKNDEVPTLATLKSVYGPISDVLVGRTAQERFEKLAADRRANSKGGTVPHANNFAAATPAESFAAQAFYHMPAPGPPPTPELEEVDFHRALTFIGQHGVLQRALGLVFDLQIPLKEVRLVEAQPGSNIYVSASLVNPQGLPLLTPGYVSVTPRTHCDASSSVFESHSNSGQINGRQLTVNDTKTYLPHVIDFDSAGLRASNFAAQIHLIENPGTIDARLVSSVVAADPDTPLAPPAMRSNGLTLTEVNRGQSFAQLLERAFLLFDAVDTNNGNNNNNVPDLAAEDLVRGYVLDVLDTDDNTWRSTAEWLCTYTAGGQTVSGPTSPPFSESATQAPPRVQDSPLNDGTSQANVSEVLLRYNGWSNAVPRPGDPTPLNAPNETGLGQDGPFSQLTIDVKVPPGRLPRLRFGHTYAMRARVVDVCNNLIPVDGGANVGDSQGRVTDPMVYGRLDPIGSPDIYSQNIPRLGESIKRLVIRDVDGSSALSKRALAPKRSAEPFAEWHSKFDTGAGNTLSGSASTYNEIVGHESAQYPDPPPDPTHAPPTISLTGHVPYLPDPLARGGVLTVLPGTGAGAAGSLAGQQFTFDFCPPPPADNWPSYQPFGLQLGPGTSPPSSPTQKATTDAANRLITFRLTKADTIILNLASIFDSSDFKNFGLGQFLVNPDASAASQGNYWAITPPEQIELIYAVQKPLLTPEFSNFGPARAAGDTVAELVGDLTYSPKSTSTIDVIASWGDPVDDPVNKLPLQGPGTPNPNLRQTSNAPVTTLPSSTSGLPSADTQEFTATDRFAARHEFFDTKHRNVTYSAVATSQFSEFYPPGTDVNVGTARPATVNIPSSARPDTAKIVYAVPIYGWGLSTPHAGTTVSARSPSALRVFIDRPWWSSGIDELLGVVTWPGAEPFFFRPFSKRGAEKARLSPFGGGLNAPIPDNQAHYVSDWGADPVFQSTPLPSLHPRVSSFPNAVHSGFGLSIEEDSSFTVNVAGHPVQFDASRNLWYCDIAINVGSTYTPMVKLALARYQPNSVAGVELSRIKLADIMSLEPGRTATVVRKNSHQLSSVTLTGVSYSKSAASRAAAPGQAELIVEKRKAAIHDDTLGWEPVGDPIQMTAGHSRGGLTSWTALNVKVPASGQVRLAINQYEVLPTDNRKPTRGFYTLTHRSQELRLLYQDVIPL
ncbi:MAG TPA: hypothetical protein VGI87_12775 [Solirubrobacteraceae bacterium]